MPRTLQLILIAFYLASCKPISNADRGKLIWKEGKMLKWSQFKSKVPTDRGLVSGGARIGISYYMVERSRDVKFHVYATFNPKKSWVVKGEDDDWGLVHEQMHFNLAEIHARILRSKIINFPRYNWDTNYYDSLYSKQVSLLYLDQDLYDLETNHCLDSAEQRRWNRLILEKLDSLKAYKEPIIIIP